MTASRAAQRGSILAGCKPWGTVLDPFLGSGTTLVAARRLGCAGIGIELNPAFALEAVTRIRAIEPERRVA